MTTPWNMINRFFQWRLDRVRQARALGVRVGRDCRIYDCHFGSEPYLITIGNHVTITSGVQFYTHDGGVWLFRAEFPDIERFAPITVGNNVFIGAYSILLPGAAIGDNCVIGAGSVVTGHIPSNCVAAGTPARRIKSLDEYRDKVLRECTHIRKLSREEKRRILCTRFNLPDSNTLGVASP